MSEVEKRDLEIEINFLLGLVQRDPKWMEAFRILADDCVFYGDYKVALALDKRVVELNPDDHSYFNLACSYSLCNEPEKAISAILRAIKLGYSNLSHISRNPYLANARKHPKFKRVREKIKLLKSTEKV